jgi:putative DNA modification/repair radical SAM protein
VDLKRKLSILADAAKYDASCASSGSIKRDSSSGSGMGSTSSGMGICHSYAPDGRCISLLKVLLTNFCLYDCSYCVNRASSHVERARFSVAEVVQLTLDFYQRNYIEGLFLSSGIIQSSDYTMEQLLLVAKTLRTEHDLSGYIHLKTIPDAAPELLAAAGLYADRLSINVELPSKLSLAKLAPEKNPKTISQSMTVLREHIDESKQSRTQAQKVQSINSTAVGSNQKTRSKPLVFSPAGQSTQMIVGADSSSDSKILTLANSLYGKYQMRRVYYSAFSPIPDSTSVLPLRPPPLMREHRLYQADWLIRFYGFNVQEISQQSADKAGMLDLEIDPKLAWPLNNRALFPVDINRAPKEMLLRVPGLGPTGVQKIVQARQFHALRFDDLRTLRLSVKKLSPFIEALDYRPSSRLLESDSLKRQFVTAHSQQLSLFG